MISRVTLDRHTGVAFIDVEEEPTDAKIRVIEVSDMLGLRSQVRARYDENTGTLLGLIVEDYAAFRFELMRKYVAFRVGRLLDLIVCSVKGALAKDTGTSTHLVPAHL